MIRDLYRLRDSLHKQESPSFFHAVADAICLHRSIDDSHSHILVRNMKVMNTELAEVRGPYG